MSCSDQLISAHSGLLACAPPGGQLGVGEAFWPNIPHSTGGGYTSAMSWSGDTDRTYFAPGAVEYVMPARHSPDGQRTHPNCAPRYQ